MLSIVPTPIGNLKDITLRALETLKSCDGIICEDTRRTSQLLQHYEIKKPLYILNDFNEPKQIPFLIQKLQNNENLCLVSDAGTPLVSDPGYKLVRECLATGVVIDSLPGASAPTVALTLSGFPPDKFMFVGYLPEKPGARTTTIQTLSKINQLQPTTFILFIAPFKLKKTLSEIQQILNNPQVCLARELTKIHQEVLTKKASEWTEYYAKKEPKGEFVLLLRLS